MAIDSALDCSPPFFKPAELRETLTDCMSEQVEGHPWLIVNNLELWHDTPTVTNETVNELFPDTPVLIRDTSGHTRLVNDAALTAAGIDEQTPDPPGGQILRHPKTGKPTGVLVEMAAILPVEAVIPSYPENALRVAMAGVIGELFEVGITSLQDAYAIDRPLLNRLADYDREGNPVPYVTVHLGWSHPDNDEKREQEAMIRERDTFATEHLSMRGVKVFLDGVPVPPAYTHVPLNDHGDRRRNQSARPARRAGGKTDRVGQRRAQAEDACLGGRLGARGARCHRGAAGG